MRHAATAVLIVLAFLCAFAPHAARAGADDASGRPPAEVYVGVYVNRIHSVDMKEYHFTADFWAWFRWKDADLDPVETFDVVNGSIDKKTSVQKSKSGEWNYAVCRVEAEITKFFDVHAFPLDDHVISVEIEDTAKEDHLLRYVPDSANCGVSPEVQVPGWDITRATAEAAPHGYETNYGDISLPTGNRSTYSRFVYAIELRRPGFGYFAKLFFGLAVAVAIAFLAFFIRPTDLDPRFGLGVGAIFAAVGSLYVTSSSLPDTNVMTMSDKLHIVAFAVILVSLVESTLSLHWFVGGREEASRRLDRRSFWILTAAYVATSSLVVLTR